jgi:hypothetical protein
MIMLLHVLAGTYIMFCFPSTEFVAIGIDQLRPSFTDWKQWKQRVAKGPRLDHLVQGFMGKLWDIVEVYNIVCVFRRIHQL